MSSKKYISASVNRAIMINFRNTNGIQDLGIHLTVCYLEDIPKSVYDSLHKTIKEEFGNQIQNSSWNLTFTNKLVNSWEIKLVNQRGISIESYRKAIFEYIKENAQRYISTKRYTSGYPYPHMDTSSFIYTPTVNKTFNNLNVYIN